MGNQGFSQKQALPSLIYHAQRNKAALTLSLSNQHTRVARITYLIDKHGKGYSVSLPDLTTHGVDGRTPPAPLNSRD